MAAAKRESYARLIAKLKREVAAARSQIEGSLVGMYWTIGREMAAHLNHPSSLTLTGLCRRLSDELNIHPRTLQQCHQFFSTFPRIDRSLPLNWSHYRCLMLINSPRERKRWQKRIIDENLSQKSLLALMQAERPVRLPAAGRLPVPRRGKLYHYRIVKARHVHGTGSAMMVDCGFANRIVPPPCNGKLDNTRIVVSRKTDEDYTLKISSAVTDDLFTYRALIARVVDADTLLADIDCGFGIWTRQRLRLTGIDAPERSKVAGLRAKERLARELAGSPQVVVRTRKPDKYDRYLAEVFYLPLAGKVAMSHGYRSQDPLPDPPHKGEGIKNKKLSAEEVGTKNRKLSAEWEGKKNKKLPAEEKNKGIITTEARIILEQGRYLNQWLVDEGLARLYGR